MRRMITRAAIAVTVSVLSVPLAAGPLSAHEVDPEFGGCLSRGGQLAGAWYGQDGHRADRNGDGVVCAYESKRGGFRFGDNHVH